MIWRSPDEYRNLLDAEINGMSRLLTYDSQLYFVLPENVPGGKKLELNSWIIVEIYRIKRKIVTRTILTFTLQDSVTQGNLYRGEFNLQAFVQRRRNFHQERLTATVRYTPLYSKFMRIISDHPLARYVRLDYWDLKILLNFRLLFTHFIAHIF